MRQKLAYILITFAFAGCATTPPPDTPVPDVRAALGERYPAGDVIHEPDLQFERDTPVERLDLPALAKPYPTFASI